jgi:(p)ppGpp synthase/HD superfamily hydrolase
MKLVLKAAWFASDAHQRQRRKTGDQPYINHLLRVAHEAAELGLSEETVSAALLHDVLEDTPVTPATLKRWFPDRVVELVVLLTQSWADDAPKEIKEREKPAYYAAILADPDAVCLKLLDRADNLRDMTRMLPRSPRWAEKYLHRSETELAPLYDACTNEGVRISYRLALDTLRARLRSLPPG